MSQNLSMFESHNPLDTPALLQRFFVLSADKMAVVGRDGYFKVINPAFEMLLGGSQTELLTQPLLEFVHPQDQKVTQDAINQLTTENPSINFENRLRSGNGVYQWFGWTISYTDERIFHAVVREITEQQLAAESPVGYLSHLLMDAPAGMVILNGTRQVFTLVNTRYEKISGHSRAQLLNRSIRDVLPELEANGVFQMFDHLYQTGEAFVAQEFYASFDHTGQGFLQEGYYNFVAQPIKDRNGQVTDILVHVYEVTEFVLARQRLQESEEQFRAIFNQSTAGNAYMDLEAQLLLVNDRFCQMVGYSRDELLQKTLYDITHPDDLPNNTALFERLRGDGLPFVAEKRYICKDGSIIWVRNSVSVIRDAAGQIKSVLTVSFDITELKAAQEELIERQPEKAIAEERQRLARELHDSVTQTLFSAGVITEAIPRLLQAQPEKAFNQLHNLNSMIQGATSELRTLLWELRPERIAQTGLAMLLTQLAYAVQARKPLKVFLRIHGEQERLLPAPVLMAFYRIAQESINNIIKHSDATKIHLMMRRTDDYVMMSIIDDGQGFDLLQGNPGFGLTIMRERAEEADAQLDIRSMASKGTRIRLFWQGESDVVQIVGGE
ncbi:MAG: PAS domain S-box protein [Anaerolineaceae bacterium]|nr:PAS domain S-box protein [Anaerolineaceae bacterium]